MSSDEKPVDGATTPGDEKILNSTEKPEVESLTASREPEVKRPAEVSLEEDRLYLSGWKLHFLTTAICLCMFLSSLEVTIVSTTLVSITNDFQSYTEASWIVTSYLLTYTGFIIIWAKVSDLLGRKLCLVSAIVLFSAFSGACGAAQTMTQLIILRAFQGIGGSGMVSLSFIMTVEMVPATKYALYGAISSFSYAVAYLLGPIFGGLINDNTTWRWIFLLNPPGGVLALILVLLAMPNGFPNIEPVATKRKSISRDLLSRVDFLGFLLLLGASIFFVVALEESGITYAWSDALPISFLVISGILWISFFVWSKIVSQEKRAQEPIFTWAFIQNRVFLGVLLIDLLAGIPFFVTIIQIPQRFQIVNGLGALDSGVRMLAFILCVPFGSSFAAYVSSKLKVPPIMVFGVSCALQIIGTALLSTISVDIPARVYGYEAILGFGVGLNIGSVVILTPNLIRGKDQAVAMAAMMQLRALGGVIGLSIASNVLINHVRSNLTDVLPPEASTHLLQSASAITALPAELQIVARHVYANGYSLQMKAMIGFGAAQVIAIPVMWEKKLRRVA